LTIVFNNKIKVRFSNYMETPYVVGKLSEKEYEDLIYDATTMQPGTPVSVL